MTACGGDDVDDQVVNPVNPETGGGSSEIELTAENLAKYVTANISYNSNEWLYSADIQTSLMSSPFASILSGKDVKYGMRVYYETRYTSNDYGDIKAWWVNSDREYANVSGSNYQVSVYTPYYSGTTGYQGGKKVELDEIGIQLVADAMNYQETVYYLKELIDDGEATEADKNCTTNSLQKLKKSGTPLYGSSISCINIATL